MAEVKQITGCFTGAYAKNPFNGKQIPVWIAEYVLAGYGTGAIMAVPCGDQRDFLFAKHFNIPITNIIGEHYNGEEANPTKDAILENSDFLNGMLMKDAIGVAVNKIEEAGIGKRKINYRMRDAGFSRQRYWGEPFPIVWKDGVAIPLNENELPLELPHVEKYGPGPEGEGPLANIEEWVNTPEGRRETPLCRVMQALPGIFCVIWILKTKKHSANAKQVITGDQVDVYIGGTEHAVGHLLYSRMWTKVLFDLGLIGFDEPFKKLVNQGMIQGSSRFVYRFNNRGIELLFREFLRENFEELHFTTTDLDENPVFDFKIKLNDKIFWIEVTNSIRSKSRAERYTSILTDQDNIGIFISTQEFVWQYVNGDPKSWFTKILESKDTYQSKPSSRQYVLFATKQEMEKWDEDCFDRIHVDVNIVDGVELNRNEFKKWKNGEYADAEFILEDGKYICGAEIEKMSKSKYNTVNPDVLVDKYGADTFRMYEMFLGPVEQSKPWDTKGIEGVHRFLKKLWRLFFDEMKGKVWNEDKPNDAEFKVLHKTIKKIEQDTESFSYNTAVSAFMVCVNELSELKCHKKEVLENVLILLTPYAPHIAEELWHVLGNAGSVLDATYPKLEEKYLLEATKEYPVSINGKLRTAINLPTEVTAEEAEKAALANETVQKWLEGKAPKKFIFVKGRMINVVI